MEVARLLLNSIILPSLNSKSFDICESEITEKDLITTLKSIPNGKSPGHDGLTKQFCEHSWGDLKFCFIDSLKQAEIDGHLPISQRQATIKLTANFVLNVDIKMLFKSLAEKLKHLPHGLISSIQTAYVENRRISKSDRLVSDVIEMCHILDILGYLVTMDIKKALDSLDHDFLLFFKISVLTKISFVG